jgi:hypothetical protein
MVRESRSATIVVSIKPDEPLRDFLEGKAKRYGTTVNQFLANLAHALYLWEVEGDARMAYLFPNPPVSDDQVSAITQVINAHLSSLTLSAGHQGGAAPFQTDQKKADTVDEDAIDAFLDGLV